MQIGIVGNCLSYGIASCLQFYQPWATITSYVLPEFPSKFRDKREMLAEFSQFDLLIAIAPLENIWGDPDLLPILRRECGNLLICPPVNFHAFHPDCVIASRRDTGELIHSALGDYNSALALFGYTEGMGVEETLRLYHARVYERAGYFDAWTSSQEALMAVGRQFDFPLDKLFRSWTRRGVFMHSINHPKLFVLADLAAQILRGLGIEADARLVEGYVPDELLNNCVWPLYPELGRAMGLPGSYVFKAGQHFYDLRAYVEASFAMYASYPGDQLRCTRLEAWKRDQELVECLSARAHGRT